MMLEPDKALPESEDSAIAYELPAVPASVSTARNAVKDLAVRHGASLRRVDDIRLAVSEAVTNSVQHAYTLGTVGDFRLRAVTNGANMTITIEDDGCGLSTPTHNPGLRAGLMIIQSVSDHASIRTSPIAGTTVRMRFRLDC